MLEILGTIGGNVLSLPGVLGLALGMMTRNLALGAVLGGAVGLLEALVFAGFSFVDVGMTELVFSILVGVLAGCLGSLIRRKGAQV